MARGPGRPCKLTPEVQERICGALAKGLPRHVAATRGGIRYKTMREWESQGRRQKNGKFRAFCLAVEHAEHDAIEYLLGIVQKAAKPHTEKTVKTKDGPDGMTTEVTEKKGVFDWRAAFTIMERRWSADWGAKQTAEIAKLEAQVEELRKAIMESKKS